MESMVSYLCDGLRLERRFGVTGAQMEANIRNIFQRDYGRMIEGLDPLRFLA